MSEAKDLITKELTDVYYIYFHVSSYEKWNLHSGSTIFLQTKLYQNRQKSHRSRIFFWNESVYLEI